MTGIGIRIRRWLASIAFVVSIATFAGQPAEEPAGLDAQALFDRGTVYWFGYGPYGKDFERACALFEQSANLGNVSAQYNLGNCYRTGQGKPADLRMALRLYEKAAASGDLSARLAAANIYLFDGSADMRQPEAGIRLLRELVAPAKRSFQHAQARNRAELVLGVAYYRGLGVDKNDQTAVTWYEAAARHGNQLAQALLYEIYSGRTNYEIQANAERARLYRDAFEMSEQLETNLEQREVLTLSTAIDDLAKRKWLKGK